MIVWLNGPHGVGISTTAALVQPRIPDSLVLHADTDVLRGCIEHDAVLGLSAFRVRRIDPYLQAYAGWLGAEAEVIDTGRRASSEVVEAVLALLER